MIAMSERLGRVSGKGVARAVAPLAIAVVLMGIATYPHVYALAAEEPMEQETENVPATEANGVSGDDASDAPVLAAMGDDRQDDRLYWLRAESFPGLYSYRDGNDWSASRVATCTDTFYATNPPATQPTGSYAYAYDFVRRVHRVRTPESGTAYAWNASALESGDVLKTSAGHWIVVIFSGGGSDPKTAEGDYAGKVRAGNGKYQLRNGSLVDAATGKVVQVASAYHYKRAGTIRDKAPAWKAPDKAMKTLSGNDVTLNGTYGGKRRVIVWGDMGCGSTIEVFNQVRSLAARGEYQGITFILASDPDYRHDDDSETFDVYRGTETANFVPCDHTGVYITANNEDGRELRVPWYCYFGGRTSTDTIRSYDLMGQPYVFAIDEHDMVVGECIRTDEKDLWIDDDALERFVCKTFGVGRSIADAKVTCADQYYTGSETRGLVSVVHEGRELDEGTDYSVTILNGTNPGTATVTITGMGTYVGTKTATYAVLLRPKTFPDVSEDAWYAGVVSRATQLGLFSGYADGRFGPEDKVTRGQVAVILWNMAGKPAAKAGAKTFPDVAAGKYYYDAVRWASSVGVVSGYKNGRFGPNDNVTREQLAAMLASYARKVAGRETPGSAADYRSMRDAGKVSGWAASSVGWCFRSKILSGANGYVNPQGNATRAETAKMVVFEHDLLR